jgi:hypothetical protein
MRTKAEIEAILKDVRARLDAKRRATGVDLRVPQDGYLEDDGWLNVIVSPGAEGVRAFQYVDLLSEVEKELRNTGLDKVLLVPAGAD